MDICVWWGSVATVLPFAVDKQDGVEVRSLCIMPYIILMTVSDSGPCMDEVGRAGVEECDPKPCSWG